jgi:hypothetical protein
MLNLNEVRDALSKTIIQLQAGTTTPNVANAISKATGKLLVSIKLEIDYHRLFGTKVPAMEFFDKK